MSELAAVPAGASDSVEMKALVRSFSVATPEMRRATLAALVRECHVRELSELESMIVPRLKVDFLQRLPLEVALHILSFLEDPCSLLRAAAVSRTWHRLATDEYLWGFLCVRYAYHTPSRLRWMTDVLISTDFDDVAALDASTSSSTQSKRRRRRSFFADATDLPQPTQTTSVSLRDYFELSYKTDMNWQRGGRVLSTYMTHALADADPDPNRRLALTCCAMDRDYIVAGMTNSTIFILSSRTGSLLHVLQGHESGVWCLMLATGTSQAQAPNVSSNDLVRVMADERPSASLSPSPHGGLSVQDARHVAQQCDPTNVMCASTAGWGREETRLVSAGSDRSLRVWNLAQGTCEHVLKGHTSTIRCVQVVAEEPVAVTGSRDGTLRVWDLEQGKLLHVLVGHQHSVRCLSVAGSLVASGSYDFTCRIWDWRTGACMHVLKGHQLQIYAVAFDGRYVVTGSSDSTVRVWDAATGASLAVFQGYTHVVAQLHLHDGILATGSSDGRVIVYSMHTFECLFRVCAHDSGVTTLQMQGGFLVTGGSDGLVKLWDAKTGRYIRQLCEPCDAVWTVRVTQDMCVVLGKRHGKCSIDVVSLRPVAGA